MEPQNEEMIRDVAKKLSELSEMERTADLLHNNNHEFLYKENTYRIHRPLAWEKDEINKERMKKYIEFLSDPAYLFKKQLIELLKKKNIDISKMDNDTQRLNNKEKELLKQLAVATIKQDVDILKQEIQDVRIEIQTIFYDKEELLKYCIEKQLEDFVRFYLLYMVLEIKKEDKWERTYKNFDEFQKSDDDLLLGRAAQVLGALVFNEPV